MAWASFGSKAHRRIGPVTGLQSLEAVCRAMGCTVEGDDEGGGCEGASVQSLGAACVALGCSCVAVEDDEGGGYECSFI